MDYGGDISPLYGVCLSDQTLSMTVFLYVRSNMQGSRKIYLLSKASLLSPLMEVTLPGCTGTDSNTIACTDD